MSKLTVQSTPAVTRTRRHRRSLVAIESTMAVFGLGGGIMLVSGYGAPPVEALAPLGLSTWVLPGLWLTASVAVRPPWPPPLRGAARRGRHER